MGAIHPPRRRAASTRDRDRLTQRLAQFDAITPPAPFDAAAATDDQLTAEHARIAARGAELSALETLDDTQSAELLQLAEMSATVAAAISERTARAGALSAARDTFTAAPAAAPAAPAPAAAPEPIIPTAVTPAAEVVPTPSVADLSLAPAVVPTRTGGTYGDYTLYVSTDAAGITGRQFGAEFPSFTEVADAVRRTWSSQPQTQRGPGRKSSHALAELRRTRTEFALESTASMDDQHDMLKRVRNERARFTGGSLAQSWANTAMAQNNGRGSLTAAAGWCAPSENDYSLCTLWSTDGMIDLPTVQVSRGGLNYTQGLDYAAIDAATQLTFLTEAQVIADTPKVCSEVPCPTFVNRRLDVVATCVTGSFLQAAGYPEAIDQFVDGSLVKHQRQINEILIAAMVTQAGAVTPIVLPPEDSATSAILAAADLAATDTRYRYRMARTATIEQIFPDWVRAVIRADLSRRNGVDMLAVQDAQIINWFAVRNIRPQFVYDWQDGYSGGGATSPGGDATPPYTLAFPGTVLFLSYPAGSVAVARQDVISLSAVYDSTNIAQNLYTEIFNEEGFAPIFPCPGLRLYSALACPSGTTGWQADLGCVVDVP